MVEAWESPFPMCNSAAHNNRPNRESLSKRLGLRAWALKARDGECCVYCGKTAETSGAPLQLDHVDTTIKGTPAGDCPANLVLACRSCNSSRQNMTLAAWAAIVAARKGVAAADVIGAVKARLAAKLDLAAGKALKAARTAKN